MTATLTEQEIHHLLAEAREYRSNVVVRAEPVTEQQEWTTAHGDVLHADEGDWWVIDGEDRWSVAGPIFTDTYENVEGDMYRKVATINAVKIDRPFAVDTLEGIATGQPGDWLVRNPSGECWPVPAEVFARRYEAI